MNTTAIATKFVKWDIPELSTLKNTNVYILRERLNKGDKLNRDEKNWITKNVNNNAYFKSGVPLHGYCFNFSDVLKTFVVKQYESYREYKAIDKTSLRAILYGRIDRIIEI